MQSPDLEEYQRAVWDFLLEHCDITDRGSYFIKFHTSGQSDFEKRIRARWKYNYHRVDERSNYTNRQKQNDAQMRQLAHSSEKEAKRRKYILGREERIKALEAVKIENEKRKRLEQMPIVLRVIHKHLMQPLAHKWYNIKQWKLNRLKKENR